MSRALVTFATGDFERLLELSGPGFQEYADRHGYQFHFAAPRMLYRPPSWMKVSVLLDALTWHEEVLWVDCDVVIVDHEVDIADEVHARAWQALVCHHTPDGAVPNCGVWFVRQPMKPVLEQLWRMDRYVDHVWWEQAAMLDLLGYRHEPRPVVLERATDLFGRTHWLGLEWNSHEENDRHPSPRFAHATAGPLEWRANVMRDYLTRAVAPAIGG